MRILICGDRDWIDKDLIRQNIPEGTTAIIEGDARGADKMAGEIAKELGIDLDVYPAPWEEYRKRYPYPMCLKAGTDRNTQMLVEGRPSLILAFHNDIKKSKGTKNMIKQGKKAGIHIKLYNNKGELVLEYNSDEGKQKTLFDV